MLRKHHAVMALAVTMAVAPLGLSQYTVSQKNASASPTFRPNILNAGKTRSFTSSGEFRVCNEGATPVRMWVSNSLTNAPTDSLLEPGRCAMQIGSIMTFTNDGEPGDPVAL